MPDFNWVFQSRLREWERRLWNLSWHDGLPRDACLSAERQVRALNSLLEKLIWELFDFRKRTEESGEPVSNRSLDD